MSGEMADRVRAAYDANAELYASLFLDELERDAASTEWLAAFADLAAQQEGPVVDVGCGPGSVVRHLVGLGVQAKGVDLSSGQIAQARLAFPDLDFAVGDLAALGSGDGSLGGIVARYSVIHLAPASLVSVFEEWWRVLQPGAPALLSFFGSRSADAHGRPFDHNVVTAHQLWPAAVSEQLAEG